jgi:DNA modification methylase
VQCHVITSQAEGAVVANIERKERQAAEMFDEIVRNMSIHELNRQAERSTMEYETDEKSGDGWRMLLGDACERLKEIDADSVGLSVFSPPFPGMYAYTNSERDVGNVASIAQLLDHFAFLMPELLRVTMPGRMCCVHLTQEPVFKAHDGYVGLRDFRGDTIARMQDAGWIYYGEVCIDKNPMLKASRTKEHTLLFKTLGKDSSGCRPALADYVLIFRKRGENPIPITAGQHQRWNPDGGWITADEWCEWAAPVWYRAMPQEYNPHSNAPPQENYPSRHQATDGILETDVLKVAPAREADDEKHLCPLQLGVIERCVKLWSAPGDLVLSPFAGIGSEGYKAVTLHRRFVGIELKRSYWAVACSNLARAEAEAKATGQQGLFGNRAFWTVTVGRATRRPRTSAPAAHRARGGMSPSAPLQSSATTRRRPNTRARCAMAR